MGRVREKEEDKHTIRVVVEGGTVSTVYDVPESIEVEVRDYDLYEEEDWDESRVDGDGGRYVSYTWG